MPVQPQYPSQNKDYRKFMRQLRADPTTLPPAAPFTSETRPEETRYSFYFWWYPGNAFGELMVPRFPALSDHLIKGGTVAGHLVPSTEELEAERAARAEQPLIHPIEEKPADKASDKSATTPAEMPPGEIEIHDDHLETSPTKDHAPPAASPGTDHSAPAAGDPASGFSDSGTPTTSSL